MVTPLPDLQVEIRNSATGALITDLPTAFEIEWETAHNNVGRGTFQIPGDDVDGNSLAVGRDIYCYYRGTLVEHLVLLSPPTRVLVSSDEEAGQVWSVDAPTVLDEWAYAKVLPYRGQSWQPGLVNAPLPFMPQHRLYTFASPDYYVTQNNLPPGFGSPGGWHYATAGLRADQLDPNRSVTVEYRTVTPGEDDTIDQVQVPAPLDWKVPQAQWIWSQPDTTQLGYSFFLKTIVLTERKTLTFDVTADNYYIMFVDGNPMVGEDTDYWGWQNFKRYTDTFEPGAYDFGFVVKNTPGDGNQVNTAGLLFGAYVADSDGVPVEFIEWTNNTWIALGYPPDDAWPGWTAGQIIYDALLEAQARGFLPGWSIDFNSTTDSNGDPWPQITVYSSPVGSSLLDVLRDLVKQGHVDLQVQPGTRVLKAFVQSDGFNSGISIATTGNVATQNLSSSDFTPIANVPISTLVVKWSEGYVSVHDPAAATAFRPREDFVSVDAETVQEAIRQGEDILERNNAVHWANVVGTEPLGPGDAPYLGYSIGWRVTSPGIDGTPSSRRVKAITMRQTEEGVARPVLDIGNELQDELAASDDLLDTLGRGIVGSGVLRNTAMVTGRSARAKSSTYSPATTPIFDAPTIRGQRSFSIPSSLGGGGLAELPPFNFGGLIRTQFAKNMRSGVYVPSAAVAVRRLDWTLANTDEILGFGTDGPIFQFRVNDVVVYTSARCVASGGGQDVTINIAAGARVHVEVSDQGNGAAVGLTVMARL